MKQTAVEWLADELTLPEYGDNPQWVLQVIEQAKEMEKEQIIEAHEEGFYSPPFRMSRRREAEQYYNITFKTKQND
jgi:hypothetical protein